MAVTQSSEMQGAASSPNRDTRTAGQKRVWTVWFWAIIFWPVAFVLTIDKTRTAKRASAPSGRYWTPLVMVVAVAALFLMLAGKLAGELNQLGHTNQAGSTYIPAPTDDTTPAAAGATPQALPANWTPSCATKSNPAVATAPLQIPAESSSDTPTQVLNSSLLILQRAYQTGNAAYLTDYEFGASNDDTLQEQIGGSSCYDSITVVGTPTVTADPPGSQVYHIVATVQLGSQGTASYNHWLYWQDNDGPTEPGQQGWWQIESDPNS